MAGAPRRRRPSSGDRKRAVATEEPPSRSSLHHPRPEVREHPPRPPGRRHRPGEVERAGGEHARPAARLVVASSAPSCRGRRDAGSRRRPRTPRGDAPRDLVDLDAAAPERRSHAEIRSRRTSSGAPASSVRPRSRSVTVGWPTYCTPISAASGRPRSRQRLDFTMTSPSRSTRQKKLFADRNMRLPPRSRYPSTRSYSRVVTYSWWPAKTIRSYACASAAGLATCSRSHCERYVDLPAASSGASSGTRGGMRKPYGTPRSRNAPPEPNGVHAACRRTTSPRARRRRRRGSCTPARSASAGRPRPDAPDAAGRDDERREAEAAVRRLGGARSRAPLSQLPTCT